MNAALGTKVTGGARGHDVSLRIAACAIAMRGVADAKEMRGL